MAKGTKTLNSGLMVDDNGTVFINCLGDETESGDMGENEVSIWVNEGGNKLMCKVKYSNGAIKTGELTPLS